MVSLECPWCEEAAHLPYPLPEEPSATFSCADCGTTIDWSEEPLVSDLAA